MQYRHVGNVQNKSQEQTMIEVTMYNNLKMLIYSTHVEPIKSQRESENTRQKSYTDKYRNNQ